MAVSALLPCPNSFLTMEFSSDDTGFVHLRH